MPAYTFKAQAKKNAKRFLTKTCNIPEASLDQYLTQADGEWGTYVDLDGKPVPHSQVNEGEEVDSGGTGVQPASGQSELEDKPEPVVPATNPLPPEEPESPAPFAAGKAAEMVAETGVPLEILEEPEELPQATGSAFGAFAMAQLTAPTNHTPAEPQAGRNASSPTQNAGTIKIEKHRPTQNGVTRPSAGTTCAAVWDLAQQMTDAQGSTVALSVLVAAAVAKGINQFTARTQYARWRSYNGITGRVTK